jgi:glutamine synthetase
VYNLKDKPHISNSRADLRKVIDSEDNSDDILFGVEQEYILINPKNQQPWQWPERYDEETKEMKTMFPGPQGRYYCGTGNFIRANDIVEEHARRCLDLGLKLTGTNAEVMLSQWEYQLGPQNPLELADDLWMARFVYEQLAHENDFAVEYWPKLFKDSDQWNGTGCHINFSTSTLRDGNDNTRYVDDLLVNISDDHKDHIKAYGKGNEFRLTGKNETCHIDSFEWGNNDRSVAIRIPHNATYLEDRRPAGNIDPYEAFRALVTSVIRADREVSKSKTKKKKEVVSN